MKSSRLQQLFSFLEEAPNDAFTLYSIAYEYMLEENIDKAIEYFQQLRGHHPNYVGLYYHLGKCLERIDEQGNAIGIYHEGIAVAKEKQEFHALSELQGALNSALGLDFEDDI